MLAANPNPSTDTNRALMQALVEWVVKDTPPPPSRYPRLDRGDLVPPTQAAIGFPLIPGQPLPDGVFVPLYDYDFGPGFRSADVSGVMALQPPVVRQMLPTLVPKVDADGNEIAGVRSVLLEAPLGTYTGWNPIAPRLLQGQHPGARRRLHSVREDEGAAAGVGRSAAVARRALRHARRLRGAREGGREAPGGGAVPAAGRRRPHRGPGREEQRAALSELEGWQRRREGLPPSRLQA